MLQALLNGSWCRDAKSDVYISRREVSRRHAEITVDEDGQVRLEASQSCPARLLQAQIQDLGRLFYLQVFATSLGKESINVNGQPVLQPTLLNTGDLIEARLLNSPAQSSSGLSAN